MTAFLCFLLILNTAALGLFALGLFLAVWQTENEQSRHERKLRQAEARLNEINQQAQAAILDEVVRQTRRPPGPFWPGNFPPHK